MGRGSSKAGGGGGAGSNAKYQGFSITDAQGNTENYIVVNGKVQYADGSMGVATLGLQNNALDLIQQAFDLEGDTQGLINRINNLGISSASTLSDKEVVKLQKKRKADRAAHNAMMNKNIRGKKGVNRHRAYWSAM